MENIQNTQYNPQNVAPQNIASRKKIKLPPIGTYVGLILWSLYILIPFWIIFVTAMKTIQEAVWADFTWWPQQGFHFDAFRRVFADGSLLRGFWNTLRFYLPTTVIGVLVSALSAYGFAKMEWKGRDAIFSFLMLTMMLPSSVTMTASRLMYDTIGWIGTPLPIMIPGMFGSIGIVFFLRQYMKGIPNDLIGAAKVDGMNEFNIFLTIILPLSMPALLTQAVLGFLAHYNDYMGALLYLIDEPLFTLQIAISTLSSTFLSDFPAQMAAAFVGMLPMLIIYALLQKYILKGISMSSGLKG